MIKLSSLRSILAPWWSWFNRSFRHVGSIRYPIKGHDISQNGRRNQGYYTIFAPLMVTSELQYTIFFILIYWLSSLFPLLSFCNGNKGTTYSEYCIYYTTDRPSVEFSKRKKARINLALTFPFQLIILQLLSRLLPCPNVPMEGPISVRPIWPQAAVWR